MNEVMQCKESAIVHIDGVPTAIFKGQTRAHAGHALVTEHPELWEPLKVQYEVTENTSARTRDTGRTDAPKTEVAKKVAVPVKKAAPAKKVAASNKPAAKKAAAPKPQGLTTADLPGGKGRG